MTTKEVANMLMLRDAQTVNFLLKQDMSLVHALSLLVLVKYLLKLLE